MLPLFLLPLTNIQARTFSPRRPYLLRRPTFPPLVFGKSEFPLPSVFALPLSPFQKGSKILGDSLVHPSCCNHATPHSFWTTVLRTFWPSAALDDPPPCHPVLIVRYPNRPSPRSFPSASLRWQPVVTSYWSPNQLPRPKTFSYESRIPLIRSPPRPPLRD